MLLIVFFAEITNSTKDFFVRMRSVEGYARMVIGVTESCIKRNVKSFINILQHNHDILDVNEIRRSHKQQIFVRDDNKKKRSKKHPRH